MRIDDPRIGRFLSVDPLTKGYPMLTPYQYASRIYDPRIGKFLSVDPLAMEYSDQSSYAYAANSPIRLIDVFGMGPGDPPGFWDKARLTFTVFMTTQSQMTDKLAGRVMPSVLGTMNGAGRTLSFGLYSRSAEDIGLNEEHWQAYDRATLVGQSAPIPGTGSLGNTGSSPSLALANTSTVYKAVTKNFRLTTTLFVYSKNNEQESKGNEGDNLADDGVGGSAKTTNSIGGQTGVGGINELADYDQARNGALKWLQSRSFKAEKAVVGKFGTSKGKPIGMSSADGKQGFRVEYDNRNGAHINVWSGKEKGPHFRFNASEETVNQIIKRFSK